MNSFDPMAAAINWLDAYRAADLSIVHMYAPNAVLESRWEDNPFIEGKGALAEYWRRQFVAKPAGALEDLTTFDETILLSYEVPNGVVQARLKYSDAGLILRHQCGPAALS